MAMPGHPAARRALSRVLGYPWNGMPASYERLARLLPTGRLQLQPPSNQVTSEIPGAQANLLSLCRLFACGGIALVLQSGHSSPHIVGKEG
jgi:hypothetical protein